MRGFCATFATKSGKEKRATWSPERKNKKNRKNRKDRKDRENRENRENRNSCPSCFSCFSCPSCPSCRSCPSCCSRVSFLIPAPQVHHNFQLSIFNFQLSIFNFQFSILLGIFFNTRAAGAPKIRTSHRRRVSDRLVGRGWRESQSREKTKTAKALPAKHSF